MIQTDKFHSPAEVAEQLAVHRRTVLRLIARGELRAYRVGQLLRISAADVDDFLSRHEQRAYASER